MEMESLSAINGMRSVVEVRGRCRSDPVGQTSAAIALVGMAVIALQPIQNA
jgi:hypothetical protein